MEVKNFRKRKILKLIRFLMIIIVALINHHLEILLTKINLLHLPDWVLQDHLHIISGVVWCRGWHQVRKIKHTCHFWDIKKTLKQVLMEVPLKMLDLNQSRDLLRVRHHCHQGWQERPINRWDYKIIITKILKA